MQENGIATLSNADIKCHEVNITHRNIEHINNTAKRLVQYYSDEQKKERRKEAFLCKYCYYFMPDRIGGASITSAHCKICGKEMWFDNTCTDFLCDGCSKARNLCKHCGGRLD